MSVEEMEAVVSVARARGSYVCAHSGGAEHIRKAANAGIRSFEHAYQLDREACQGIREAGGYIVPTLTVTRSPEWMNANRFEEWTIEKALAFGPDHLESIRTAVKEGVRLVNGTDMPPGDENKGTSAGVREMELMVEAGLSPLESIRASTLNAAELMGIANEVGVVEPGYHADLVAVRENPLEDIRSLEGIFFVMQSGQVIRQDQDRS
jgi:imidazolonepropionase-like amidohydrolase